MNKNCYDTYTCTCHQKRQRTFYTSLHCVVTETSMKQLDTFGEISQYTYTVHCGQSYVQTKQTTKIDMYF